VRRTSPLVSATIALAHQLGMKVTAEGVETPAQLAFLRRQGCDFSRVHLQPAGPRRAVRGAAGAAATQSLTA